ncbi:MAG: DciA family protein [Polyangiales bacterium]
MRKPRRRRRDRLRPLADLVRKAHPVPTQVDMARIVAWWCTVLPPRIAARARPAHFRHGIVHVHTVSSTWAQELSFMSTDILQRLREADLGVQVVGLRFRTGPMPPPFERRTPKRIDPEGRPRRDLPAPVGRALATVGDDDLRELIARAAASSLRLQDD